MARVVGKIVWTHINDRQRLRKYKKHKEKKRGVLNTREREEYRLVAEDRLVQKKGNYACRLD